jgi:seryl-tRNA synthetase
VIDQRLLRTDLDAVKSALARRGRPAILADVDAAAALDAQLVDITTRRDAIRARVNTISKEVGALRRTGDVDAAEVLQAESRDLGAAEHDLAGEHDRVAAELHDLLLGIPNLPAASCPDGPDDTANPVVTGPVGSLEVPVHQRVPHWETATALGVLDNERAVKVAGAMFTMQRGPGAMLVRALCQYGLDLNADAHEEVRVPSLVTTATLTATGQLPKFADDAYALERDDLWAIPTAEVPLTSVYAGEVLDDRELPIRLMAHSASYRREAGSAGRDTRGMLRSHEFDKVEILAFALAEQAPALLDDMVARAVRAIDGLGLTYRVLEICTGDLSQSHHRSFDVEVYAPGVDAWLEVSSVSWFGDYQARRANIRVRRHDANGTPTKGTELVHTLNGSALAVPRVWAAIVETYRNADGSVTIPEVLRPYMRGVERIGQPQL